MSEALRTYSIAQLWAVVHRRLSDAQSLRLHELSHRRLHTVLTSSEQDELQALLDLTDDFMLLRSQALALLKERGEAVDAYFRAE